MSDAESYSAQWAHLFAQFETPSFDVVADLVEQVDILKGLFQKEGFASSITGEWLQHGLGYVFTIRHALGDCVSETSFMMSSPDAYRFQIFAVQSENEEVCERRFLEYDLQKDTADMAYQGFCGLVFWAVSGKTGEGIVNDRERLWFMRYSNSSCDLSNEIIVSKYGVTEQGPGQKSGSISAYFGSMVVPRNKGRRAVWEGNHRDDLERNKDHQNARALRENTCG